MTSASASSPVSRTRSLDDLANLTDSPSVEGGSLRGRSFSPISEGSELEELTSLTSSVSEDLESIIALRNDAPAAQNRAQLQFMNGPVPRAIVLAAVAQDGFALRYIDRAMITREMVLAAIAHTGE